MLIRDKYWALEEKQGDTFLMYTDPNNQRETQMVITQEEAKSLYRLLRQRYD